MKKTELIEQFLKKIVKDSGSKGFVIGLSGGVDSSVAYALCIRAVGSNNVLAVTIHSQYTTDEDKKDCEELIKIFHTPDQNFLNFDGILGSIKELLPCADKITYGNLMARLRMMILYFYANHLNLLVCGTTDKTENFLGYFTKFGDGGADVEPIIHLTKTEVREIGRELGLPERIVSKPSSPRLFPDHLAEGELGFSYDIMDKILGIHDRTEHKRRLPEKIG